MNNNISGPGVATAQGPLALHKAFMMEGWERREGDSPFVFIKKMKAFYDTKETNGVFWDNFAPGEKQLFRNSVEYGRNWEDLQNGARSILHAFTDALDEIVGGDVASTTLGFTGIITKLNGEVVAFEGRLQLGWRRGPEGWKIRHELNYVWNVKPEDIAHYYK